MTGRTLKIFSFLLLVFLLAGVKEITAQEPADHLVISQVCLNNNQPGESWIEVYNPTDNALVLARFRVSNLKTINVLPDAVNKEGGVKVGPGEYVILCADENLFKSSYGNQVKVVNVNALSRIAAGGFLIITTKGAGEAKGAVVRYGKKEVSFKIAELAGDQAINFSNEGKSFTRKVEKTRTGITVSDFTESVANPGKSIN